MYKNYIKEEIIHCDKIPALIKYQKLTGLQCSVPLHWHKDIELNLMLNGIGEFMVNGKKEVLTPGNVLLINSEDLHMGEPPASVPVSDRRIEIITILWDYDFLSHYAADHSALRFTLEKSDAEFRRNISDMIMQIGTLYVENSFCHEMDITALLLQIGSSLMKYCIIEDSTSAGNGSPGTLHAMQEAVSYIDHHYAEPLTLQDVAGQMGFSSTYFSRKFRQMTGVTFKEYLGKKRLKQAVKDLVTGEITINEIAFQNGFPNVKSFIEIFKKEYKTTPLKYRNSLLE